MKIRISTKARIELMQIYSYLAERNADVAENIFQDIDLKLSQLSNFPYMGRERPEFAPHLRSVLVRTYLVLYRIIDDEIVIMRIVDGRMDVDKEVRQ